MSEGSSSQHVAYSASFRTERSKPYAFNDEHFSTTAWIYHYTSSAVAALVLTGGAIRLGPFSRTNDPREQREWFPSVRDDTDDGVGDDEFWTICREIDSAMRSRTKLACFTRDRLPQPSHEHYNFHLGWARARMWEQYAGSHSGACLVLDRDYWEMTVNETVESLVTEGLDAAAPIGPLTLHGEVSYVDRPVDYDGALEVTLSDYRQRGAMAIADERIRSHYQRLLLHKNTDWESEREYRTLLIAADAPFVDVPLQRCLSAVVVGERYPEPDLRVLAYRLSELGMSDVTVARCLWRNGAPSAVPAL